MRGVRKMEIHYSQDPHPWVSNQKMEDNHNCRGSPQGRGCVPILGSPAEGSAPGRRVPRMAGFEGQQGL